MAVEIVESCMVTPSEETPKHGLWLSNLDLLVARSLTTTICIYLPSSEPAFFSPAVLKSALSKALVPFYPLAGRLVQDNAGRLEIECSGEGALFVIARVDSTLDVVGDFSPSEELQRMLAPSVESDGPNSGILAVFQVTFFECGGVCLSAGICHAAADGLAMGDFIITWASIAKGDTSVLETSPCLDRTLLRARSPPVVCFDHAEYSWDGVSIGAAGGSMRKARVETAILPMSKEQLSVLKGDAARRGQKLSTFKAVAAHVWRITCRARKLAGTEDTRLYMAVDARSHIDPLLPARYFGNAIFRLSTVAKVDEIASGPLDAIAEKVSAAAARVDDRYVRSLVDYLDLQVGAHKGQWVMPDNDLWVISWQGLPLYGADFGWGQPAFMGRACFKASGVVYLMPGPDGDGRLDVVVAMEPESLARFREMFYEFDRYSIRSLM